MEHDTYLVLSDGFTVSGRGFGKKAPSLEGIQTLPYYEAPIGEVVFNTTMGAYQEIFSDPSYHGQIIVMTSVHIGNYGMDNNFNEMLKDSPLCKIVVIRDLYEGPVPHNRKTFAEQAEDWHMYGITDVDTRALALHIRDHGSQYGYLVRASSLSEADIHSVLQHITATPPMEQRDFISDATVLEQIVFSPKQECIAHYALIDFGVKRSIVSLLVQKGIEVHVFPATTHIETLCDHPASYGAIFLSNGPGDPASLDYVVLQLQAVIGRIPLLGICLGHQLIARALGATTSKMKFGHHGGNHPVRDLESKKVFVTAQNHGYCVEPDTLPSTTSVWLTHNNDHTVEGIYDTHKRVMSVQFHPEASPGPQEGRVLFDRFIAFAQR